MDTPQAIASRVPLAGGTALLLLGLPACSPAADAEPVAFEAPASRAGRLVLAGDTLRFLPCRGSGAGVALEDEAGGAALVRELGGGKQLPAMVRLEDQRLVEVRFAAPEGYGCERLPPEGQVEAKGNEPFWHVRVEGDEATVSTPENPGGVAYDDGRWSRPAEGRWRYQAQREGSGAGSGKPLTLLLRDERCTDSMSGARYPFTATLEFEGARLEGCALEGRGPGG